MTYIPKEKLVCVTMKEGFITSKASGSVVRRPLLPVQIHHMCSPIGGKQLTHGSLSGTFSRKWVWLPWITVDL